MPETRRELFRTSIVAAVGLSVGALVGYEIGERVFSTRIAVTPLAGSVIAVWGLNHNNGQYSWYFFVFDDTNPSECQLWSSPGPYPSSAPPAKKNVIDTLTWYSSLESKSQIIQTITIDFTTNIGLATSITVAFTNMGYLDPNSLSNLLGLMASTNTYTQIPGSWNEIGKHHS